MGRASAETMSACLEQRVWMLGICSRGFWKQGLPPGKLEQPIWGRARTLSPACKQQGHLTAAGFLAKGWPSRTL